MINDVERKMALAHGWFNDNCAQCMRCLHAFDQEGALAEALRLGEDLASSDLSDELKAYLRVRLHYVKTQARRIGATPEESSAERAKLVDYLEQTDDCELAAQARLILLIQTRVLQLRDEGIEYPAEEFHRHYFAVANEMKTNELDLHIATWGYLNRDEGILGRVFGEITVNPGQFQTSFVWQTINLAYQLVRARAAVKDIVEMVKVLRTIRHWHFTEKLLWHECRELGLVTVEVDQALRKKLDELDASGGEFAQYEERTQRIRKS